MKEPKEKARELVEKFSQCFYSTEYRLINSDIARHEIRKGALIAVDETVEAIRYSRRCFSGGSEMSNNQLKYWTNVKQEINKL